MFNFFESISETISIAIDFFIGALEMIVFFFTAIPKALVWLFEAVAFLPTVVLTFTVVIIAITVILQIMNKGS